MHLAHVFRQIQWVFFVLGRRLRTKTRKLQRYLKAPAIPQREDGRVLVHLGCGEVEAPGYINVDLKPAPHVHIVSDVTDLTFFDTGSVDLVYACHVLEHFPRERLKRVLWEWRRVLKPKGTLRLSVPDFDKLLTIYSDSGRSVESIRQPLMGAEDGYYSHLLLFNLDFARQVLEENGFENVRVWMPESASDYNFEDWASRPVVRDGRTYAISLNVEASKGTSGGLPDEQG